MRRSTFACLALAGLGLFAAWGREPGRCSAQPPDSPKPEAVNQPVTGPVFKPEGLTVTPIKRHQADVVDLCWGDVRGTAVFVLHADGLLRRIEVPAFQETH